MQALRGAVKLRQACYKLDAGDYPHPSRPMRPGPVRGRYPLRQISAWRDALPLCYKLLSADHGAHDTRQLYEEEGERGQMPGGVRHLPPLAVIGFSLPSWGGPVSAGSAARRRSWRG